MKKWLPIRKLVVLGVGSGLTWAGMRLGLDLGDDGANQAAVVLVGVAFAYVEKDPRVVSVLDTIEGVLVSRDTAPCADCPKPTLAAVPADPPAA